MGCASRRLSSAAVWCRCEVEAVVVSGGRDALSACKRNASAVPKPSFNPGAVRRTPISCASWREWPDLTYQKHAQANLPNVIMGRP
jgi:hypothetical protein